MPASALYQALITTSPALLTRSLDLTAACLPADAPEPAPAAAAAAHPARLPARPRSHPQAPPPVFGGMRGGAAYTPQGGPPAGARACRQAGMPGRSWGWEWTHGSHGSGHGAACEPACKPKACLQSDRHSEEGGPLVRPWPVCYHSGEPHEADQPTGSTFQRWRFPAGAAPCGRPLEHAHSPHTPLTPHCCP